MFRAGQKFGHYTLSQKLAKGGFGEVWLAEKQSPLVTKKVAVKLPQAEVNFAAIRQEATLWEEASGHPNVLPLIDADIYDGQAVIVSEYIEGGSLADRLAKAGRLPIEEAVRIAVGVLNGLEYLHSKNIVHRDIKPANILMQGDTPRLADFGISRAIETEAVTSTIVGTKSYMSPEAFEGVRSSQTDIWSVGVLLYHLSTGFLPFPQTQPSEAMYAILTQEPAPFPPDIPFELQRIILKALSKDRETNVPQRYQTAAAMRDDLLNFQKNFAEAAAAGGQTARVMPLDDENDEATRIRVPLVRRGVYRGKFSAWKTSPALILVAVVSFAFTAALFAFWLFRSPANETAANERAANVAEQPSDEAIKASKELYRQGDKLSSRKKYDEAIEAYTRAIELHPRDYGLYNNRGAAFHAKGEFQRAIADYSKAAELNPYHFSAYNNRGAAHEDIGNIEQAIADYRKALELDPDNKTAKNNLKKILK